MNRFYLADVTAQQTATEAFYDLETKTLVSQCSGPFSAGSGKARKAQLNFAPGFFSSPVKSDRLVVVGIGPALYAIGGNSPKYQEAYNLQPGDRMLFSTDGDGAIKATVRLNNDGSISGGNLNGNFEMKTDGEFNVNNGNFRVLP